MKILTTEQIRSADVYTIENEPVASLQLMERASEAFVEAFIELHLEKLSVTIICGQGNNGGDGLAIGRLLVEKDYPVQICMVKLGDSYSEDCNKNLEQWLRIGPIFEIDHKDKLVKLEPDGIVIDALFGSGISRAITGLPAEVVTFINKLPCPKVAVDMPSGLFADKLNPEGVIVEADFTLSFQAPKLAFLLPQNQPYVGSWQILDIGLDRRYIDRLPTSLYLTDALSISDYQQPTNNFAHKGNYGHALLVAGSKGKLGAAVLSARAALRGGLGLLTVHVPSCAYDVVQTALPEAMCQVDEHAAYVSNIPLTIDYSNVGLGPGIGTEEQTVKAFKELLTQVKSPMVIDADGLNILSKHRECLELLPKHSILTPHPKEFQRIAGEPENDYHRLKLQKNFAKQYQVFLIYKGAYSTIAFPDGRLFFNTTGNPGMATAGSGDVLTGLILGLLTRTGDPELAAVVGVYIHGLAGDLAAAQNSAPAMIASDLVDHIGSAIKKLTYYCNVFDRISR